MVKAGTGFSTQFEAGTTSVFVWSEETGSTVDSSCIQITHCGRVTGAASTVGKAGSAFLRDLLALNVHEFTEEVALPRVVVKAGHSNIAFRYDVWTAGDGIRNEHFALDIHLQGRSTCGVGIAAGAFIGPEQLASLRELTINTFLTEAAFDTVAIYN